MPVQKAPSGDTLNHLKISPREFETVPSLNYLGFLINAKNGFIFEIQNRIPLANKTFFKHQFL